MSIILIDKLIIKSGGFPKQSKQWNMRKLQTINRTLIHLEEKRISY
jgi:hypothetical protein